MKKESFINEFTDVSVITSEKVLEVMNSITIKDRNGEHKAYDVYSKKSNTRTIAIDVGESVFFVSNPCSLGNSKISSDCLVTKLLPIATCPNHSKCMHACYALKATILYTNVFIYELLYTYLAIHNPIEYVELIAKQIRDSKKEYVRLHESGDFFNKEYVDAIESLAREFPKVHFYTYTKTAYRINLPNFNIVESFIEDEGKSLINFGDKDYIDDLAKRKNLPICPSSKNEGKCMHDCKICAYAKNVLFYKH